MTEAIIVAVLGLVGTLYKCLQDTAYSSVEYAAAWEVQNA